jgi:nicotinate-nucleotide pyrophosphorylase (carboxylating)
VVRALLEAALREDVGAGDLTTALAVPPGARGRARIVAREGGVLSGASAAAWVFRRLDPQLVQRWKVQDGERFAAGAAIVELGGALAPILTGERLALNLLARLSGVATLTRACVDAVAGTGAAILDTRKTTPGWRELERAAVRAGGGTNHRAGLFDAVLLKENHVRAAGGVAAALRRVREGLEGRPPPAFVEVEVRDRAELEEALAAGARLVLLDNFPLPELREAVALARRTAPGVLLEASGGVTRETVRAVAEAGVDRISVGALTHSAKALDLTLLVEEPAAPPALGRPVLRRDAVESTMQWARGEVEAGAAHPGAVFVAREQTAGRGRHGRTWASPPGAGLYLTAVLPGPVAAPSLTLAAAVAVAEAVASATGVESRVKWPNDLLWDGRKWGGILAESAHGPDGDVVLLGVGVDVRDAPGLPADAVSLEEAGGRALDPEELLAPVLARLGVRLAEFARGGFAAVADAYARRSALGAGDRVSVEGAGQGPSTAIVAGIDPEGRLLLEGFPAPIASATIRPLRRAAS